MRPAAYEEIAKNADSTQLSTSISKTGVWDSLSDISGQLSFESNLERLQNIASYFQSDIVSDPCESNSIKISDISSVKQMSLSNISSEFSDNVATMPNPLRPFYMMQGSPFYLFNLSHLDQETKFTHSFPKTKRSAVYYGEHPYSYGGTHHAPTAIF